MIKNTTPKKTFLFLVLVLLAALLPAGLSAQQVKRVYANSVEKSDDEYLLLGLVRAGYVENEGKAIDGNTQSSATLNSTVVQITPLIRLGGQAILRLRFTGAEKPVAGVPLTIKLGLGGDVLSVLGGITVQAVNGTGNSSGNGNEVGPIYNASTLVGVLSGKNQIEFTITPGIDYDGVKIKLGAPQNLLAAGVLTTAEVFHAYFTTPATGIVCNTPIDVLYGSTGNIAGGLNPVEDPLNAIDGDKNSAALVRANVSVLNKTFLTGVFPSLSKTGDSVRVLIQPQGTGLLDATLLSSNLVIRTFNNNTEVESLALQSQILGLRLLGGTTNKYELTYPVNAPFNRIQVSLGEGLVNALNGLYVYEMGAIAPKPVISAPGIINNTFTICEGQPANITITSPEPGAIYKWFNSPAGGTEITAGVTNNGTSFSPVGLTAGTHKFYVALYRSGCTDPASERAELTITVTRAATASEIGAADVSVCIGQSAILAAPTLITPGSIPNPVFTWYMDANRTVPVTNGMVAGVTYTLNANGSLTISGLTATRDFYISLQGTGICETVAGSLKAVKVTVNETPKPVLNLSGTQIIATGTTLQLQATSAGATSYQWFKDGVQLAEASATLNLTNVTNLNAGIYTAIAVGVGSCTSVASAQVNIIVAGFGSSKTVSGLNANGKIEAGSELTYTITVTNTGNAVMNAIQITDILPVNTTFVSADNGGVLAAGKVTWTVNVPAAVGLVPGTKAVILKVKAPIDLSGISSINNIATVVNPGDPGNPQNPETGPVPTEQTRKFTSTKTMSGQNVGGLIDAGSELTYSIQVTNTGNVSLTGITISDPIPANTVYVANSANNGGTESGRIMNWTINVPFGTSTTVSFKVRVVDDLTNVGSIGNKATVTDPLDPGNPKYPEVPPTNTNPLRSFTSVKTMSGQNAGGLIDAGSELTYSIQVTNTGNVSLTGITISDPIPANTVYVANSANNGGTESGGIVNWTVNIPFGTSTTVSFKVKVADDLTDVTSIGNKATVTDPTDPGNPKYPEVPPTNTNPLRSFTSVKTMSGQNAAGLIDAGSELTYSIQITNTGNVSLTGITISDPIPANTLYVANSADNGGVESSGIMNWTVNVPFGKSTTVSFKVKVAADLTNIASIGNKATVTDPSDPGNPKYPEVPPTSTNRVFDFEVASSVSSNSPDGKAHAGTILSYSITVKNTGNSALTNVKVANPVPLSTIFASAANGGVHDAATNSINFTIPTIPVGASEIVSFTIKVNQDLTSTKVIENVATASYAAISKSSTSSIDVVCSTVTVASVQVNGSQGGELCVTSGANVEIKAVSSGVSNPVYYLYNAGTLVSSNATGVFTVSATPGSSYTYAVGISGTGYCETNAADRRMITFSVNTIPDVPLPVSASVDVCILSTTVLSVQNPVAGITYNWYTSAIGGIQVGTGANFTTPVINNSISYYVEAVSAKSCISPTRSEVKINALKAPEAPLSISLLNGPLCSGSTANLSVDNPNIANTYRWYANATGGVSLHEGNTFVSPALNVTTSYYVESVSVSGGCLSSSRTEVIVPVTPILVSPVPRMISNTPASINFGWNAVVGAVGYEVSMNKGVTWEPANGGNTHLISNLQPNVSSTISVRALGEISCANSPWSSDFTAKSSNPLGNEVFVPNTFTPNGDGRNDLLYVYGNTIISMKLRVFNQWGQQIFISDNKDRGWDGTFRGDAQPSGVYVYQLEAKFDDGTSQLKKGTITIIR